MARDDNDSSSWTVFPSRRCDKNAATPTPESRPPVQRDEAWAQPDDEQNPFVTFKRFIDNTFKTLDDGIRQLPSNMAELRERVRHERLRQAQEER